MEIRRHRVSDYDAVWDIIKEVIAVGDTYVYSQQSSKEKMLAIWFGADRHAYVALVGNEIADTFFIKDNQPDLGLILPMPGS